MERSLRLILSLLLALWLPTVSAGVRAPCSACKAVTRELQKRLDAERPEARNHLDMRHRLDKDGNRYGKLIPYIDSEQRIDDLLSTLCGSEGVNKAVELMQVNRSAEADAQQLHWEWVPLAAGPRGMGKGTRKLPANEAKTAKRELGVFCESLLERHEEELVRAIRAGTPEPGTQKILCDRVCNNDNLLQHTDEADIERDEL